MSDTLELAKQLIAIDSVTPRDKGCQDILATRLEALGFTIERLPYGDVENLWAHKGTGGPLLVFAGHTDVVPPGPVSEWESDPFQPSIRGEYLYGRGSADMKGSLAAMITAAERFATGNDLNGRLGFLITSDEEGQAINGTRKVVETFQQRGLHIDYCVVGEPSSTEQLGDTVKIGRRGSLSCKLIVKGIKGHVAYPHLALNPIHEALPVLTEIAALTWDAGNSAFPPSSFQISNIHAGVGANNVIPETLEVDFNLRYSTEISADEIKTRIEGVLQKSGIKYECQWHLSGEPFLTSPGNLIDVVSQCTEEVTGLSPQLSTAGGTSDGRFIAPTGTEVVELGPCNATIHKIDERVRIEDLEKLSRIYEAIMGRLTTDLA